MRGVVADSPDLREDLRIARSLGISLRRFLGWEPTTYLSSDGHRQHTEAEFDPWERVLWRAFSDWEADRCPGCGNSLSESLWDPDVPEGQRAKWRAIYHQCRACEVLELTQQVQAKRDEDTRKSRGKDAPHPPTHHRHWSVHRDDEKGR